jgi:regulator of replication initiation timing
MTESEQIQELSAEVDDLTRQVRSAGAEIQRLREQLRATSEENLRLRQQVTSLGAPAVDSSVVEPSPALSAEHDRLAREVHETKAKLAQVKAPGVDVDAVALRKKKLAEEIERARQTISQAALIKQQMAELEKITQKLAEENDRLRVSSVGTAADDGPAPAPSQHAPSDLPAVTVLPAPRQMIRLPNAAAGAPGETNAAKTEAENKLRVVPVAPTNVGTTAQEMSGRRLVFLNSLFGRKKD